MAERIAIVEDERLVRELVAVNLRHAGYEIVSAENFDEGKALLAQRGFDLAILGVEPDPKALDVDQCHDFPFARRGAAHPARQEPGGRTDGRTALGQSLSATLVMSPLCQPGT